jgi:hypothetical protein
VYSSRPRTPRTSISAAAGRQGRRLEIGFYARGAGKSQIAVQVSRLQKRSEVETVRATWKAALARLEGLLED